MSSDDVSDRDTFFAAADSYIKRGFYDRAKLLAEKRRAAHPGDREALLIEAICLVGMGRPEEAGIVISSVDDMIRRWSDLYTLLGDTCRAMKRMPEARRAYHAASALAAAVPPREETETDREGAPHESDREGVRDLGELSEVFHTVTLADLYIRQGHLETARAVLKTVADRDPDNAEARERLQYVETMLIGDTTGDRGAVVAELERWLRNLERGASA